ncbi:AAA family ATPase [Nonomuraea sp. H19]|uniref:AAA family ATPase n=1 Tax=Nonomuraea sp. H19 TaxID=3452206 RepID=UPI003F8893A5
MRPHRLTLTAFGSFPGTETVDFDALAEAGLFLVHGPTGAGKTTILDALCFALYGQVPGQRNSARSLRCDHAPPSAGPSVTLEVSIRGRLLRIQRSPAWHRPKLRGSGVTEEKSKVIVSEWQGSSWQGLTTRLDEAGDLVGGLLGMNADQFCQVAMLPQGDFARFLRADGEERGRLLERLFTVKVFRQAESWLAEHRKLAWRAAQELRQQVDFAIQRVEEAAGDELQAALREAAFAKAPLAEAAFAEKPFAEAALREAALREAALAEAPLTPDADPQRWAGALLDAAQAVVARAGEEHEAAEQALRAARLRYEQAAALTERQRRYAEALTLRRTLDERAEERADLQAVLDDAARADRVLPLITAARQRAEAAAKARTLAADARARARPLLAADAPVRARHSRATPTPARAHPLLPTVRDEAVRDEAVRDEAVRDEAVRDETVRDDAAGGVERPATDLAALARQRQAEIARLSELLTEEARLSVVRRDLLRVEQELAELASADESVAARFAVLPGLIEEAEARLATARIDLARIPAVQAVRDAAADLIETDRELAGLAVELEALEQREAHVSAAGAELPGRLDDAAAALADVRAETAAIPAAAAALDAAAAALEAAHRREALAAELGSATADLQVLVDRAQELRERWLDRRQARIDGMAAELARDLVDGQPCAVCGSGHHPAPASPAPSAPSAEDEQAAQAACEAALAEREAAERALAALESCHAQAAEAAAGLDIGTAETQVREAERELARLRAAAEREPALAAVLERIEADRERLREQAREIAESLAAHRAHHARLQSERTRRQTRLAQAEDAQAALGGAQGDIDGAVILHAVEKELTRLRESAGRERELAQEAAGLNQERQELEERRRRVVARLAACRTRHEELSGDAGRLTARLDAARGGDATLTARLSRLQDEVELLREALEATQVAVTAGDELTRAMREASEAAAGAGFGDVAEVEAALRSPYERERKAELLRRLDAEHAAVTSTLADPELVAAAAEPAPDLEGIEAEREAAEQAHTRLASVRDRAVARARRLAELHAELSACIDRWRPAGERHRLTEHLAALAGGTSSDNRWNMSLTSFVLGERLRQVVAAANERLDQMSAGRYLLRHDLSKTAGARTRSGGGLGLRVADGWTGVDRDPATLSGGESFITSLALALGLADVVTAEAGGAEIGTLFVDEGFGTLDEDTLDDVLDILDGLRDGGRAVGIVSHVAELRTRVPAQLKVTKSRTGSTLTTVGAR